MSCLGVNCFVEFYESFMYRFRNGNKKSFCCLPQICLDFNVVYDKNISSAYSTHSAAKSIKVCFFLCHLIISMKNKSLSFVAFLLMISVVSIAQELRFRTDSTFRIVQFTDIHYKAGAEPSKKSVSMMRATLDDVKPDLVVFTGDVVVSAPTKQGWDEVLDLVISKKIPYLVTFGNHDDENEMKRAEVAAYVAGKPYLLNKTAEINGVDGYLNGAVVIKGKSGTNAAVLYAMDSQAYSINKRVDGYGWFSHNQVEWFRKTSSSFKQSRKDTLPALAFFHIPLPEYKIAFDNIKNKRRGVRYENECAPQLNTGMYTAMLESGDVLGMFVGHDHVNDYLVDYNGIALAYGCFSGSENTYLRSKNGARVIELKEGKKEFKTYLREFDGTILYPITYPFPVPVKK